MAASCAIPGDPSGLRSGARRYAAAADRLEAIRGEAARASEQTTKWRGPASAAFGVIGDELGQELRRTAGGLRAAAGALNMLAAELEGAQQTARRAQALLSDMREDPLDLRWMLPTVPGPLQVARMCDEAHDRARAAWARADAALRAAASRLPQMAPLRSGGTGSGPQGTEHALAALLLPLVLRDDPDHVRRVLDGLNPSQRDGLVRSYPQVIGALDGAPPEMRYAANRMNIQAHVEALENERNRLRAELERLGPFPMAGVTPSASLEAAHGRRREEVKARLAVLEGKEGTGGLIGRYRRWLEPDKEGQHRQFLLFDPSGDGRVAEVFGDVDRAANVAVVVPGANSSIDNFDSTTQTNTQRLHRAASNSADGDVATVAWLGYDAPSLVDATSSEAAESGAPALARVVDGLVMNDDRVHATVVGHSYGTVVTGTALRQEGLVVDDFVSVGSPGLGDGVTDRSELGSGFELWAAKAPGDRIPFPVGGAVHGEEPTAQGFHAKRFHTNAPGAAEVEGHSQYFKRDSESLANMARIVVGDYGSVSRY